MVILDTCAISEKFYHKATIAAYLATSTFPHALQE